MIDAITGFMKNSCYEKKAYAPVLDTAEESGCDHSKFGGRVPVPAGSGLPVCSLCGKPMHLLFQLHVPSAPQRLKSLLPDAFLVGFYSCFDCNDADSFQYHIFQSPEEVEYVDGPEEQPFPTTVVKNWTEFTSYDTTSDSVYEKWSESQDLDFMYLEQFGREFHESMELNTNLFGFPYYQQGEVEVPGSVLIANFQESNALQYMWGDAGTAQLWFDEENRSFSLTWQSG